MASPVPTSQIPVNLRVSFRQDSNLPTNHFFSGNNTRINFDTTNGNTPRDLTFTVQIRSADNSILHNQTAMPTNSLDRQVTLRAPSSGSALFLDFVERLTATSTITVTTTTTDAFVNLTGGVQTVTVVPPNIVVDVTFNTLVVSDGSQTDWRIATVNAIGAPHEVDFTFNYAGTSSASVTGGRAFITDGGLASNGTLAVSVPTATIVLETFTLTVSGDQFTTVNNAVQTFSLIAPPAIVFNLALRSAVVSAGNNIEVLITSAGSRPRAVMLNFERTLIGDVEALRTGNTATTGRRDGSQMWSPVPPAVSIVAHNVPRGAAQSVYMIQTRADVDEPTTVQISAAPIGDRASSVATLAVTATLNPAPIVLTTSFPSGAVPGQPVTLTFTPSAAPRNVMITVGRVNSAGANVPLAMPLMLNLPGPMNPNMPAMGPAPMAQSLVLPGDFFGTPSAPYRLTLSKTDTAVSYASASGSATLPAETAATAAATPAAAMGLAGLRQINFPITFAGFVPLTLDVTLSPRQVTSGSAARLVITPNRTLMALETAIISISPLDSALFRTTTFDAIEYVAGDSAGQTLRLPTRFGLAGSSRTEVVVNITGTLQISQTLILRVVEEEFVALAGGHFLPATGAQRTSNTALIALSTFAALMLTAAAALFFAARRRRKEQL